MVFLRSPLSVGSSPTGFLTEKSIKALVLVVICPANILYFVISYLFSPLIAPLPSPGMPCISDRLFWRKYSSHMLMLPGTQNLSHSWLGTVRFPVTTVFEHTSKRSLTKVLFPNMQILQRRGKKASFSLKINIQLKSEESIYVETDAPFRIWLSELTGIPVDES